MRLRLRRASRRTYGDTSALSRDPELPVFMGDLVRSFGLAARPEVLAAGLGHTYGEMAEELIPGLVAPDEPVDVLVLAFGVHDVRPGRSTATYLSSITPGEPVAYAICDQGTLAPFTALRLLGEYARSGCATRAVLVVAEQSALHYTPAVPGPLPDRHAAVAFLFDRSGPGTLLGVRQVAGLRPEGPGSGGLGPALAAAVAGLAAGRGDVTLVAGAGLAGVPVPEGLALAPGPGGQPHTGPWWVLAGWADRTARADPTERTGPAGRAGGGLLVLADADPGAGELAVAAFDFSPDAGGHP